MRSAPRFCSTRLPVPNRTGNHSTTAFPFPTPSAPLRAGLSQKCAKGWGTSPSGNAYGTNPRHVSVFLIFASQASPQCRFTAPDDVAQACAVYSPFSGILSVYRDVTSTNERCYLRPKANVPKVAGWTVVRSGPLVFPAMIRLFGTVSYAYPVNVAVIWDFGSRNTLTFKRAHP
jgi:hypothetical protein